MIAVSGDREDKQEKYRLSLGAPFSFVADPRGSLIELYGVKQPLVTIAKRVTFVIGKQRKILHVDSGREAVDPSGAIGGCRLYY